MNTKPFEISDEILNKLINTAYGDANFFDKIYVKNLIRKHENVRLLFEQYSAVANEVHKVKEDEFLTESIKNRYFKGINYKATRSSFWVDFLSIIINRPLMSTITAIILITAVTLSLINNKQVEYNYSAKEITLADEQARKALGIVGRIFNETKITLRKEVLGEKIGAPIRESIGVVNIIFNKGEQK